VRATRPAATILCLASYVKGHEFLRECKRLGCRVLLLTVEKHRDAEWPRESIDERFLMPDLLRRKHVINAVSYLARSESIDRIVPLDEFDLEIASTLREHLRIPGMGETTVRYFRDKLAMRMRAREREIPVPEFVPILNYDRIREYLATVPPPWVLKPRHSASAIGIKKLERAEQLWPILDELGDRQSFHLLERFIPGDVYHVDSIVSEGDVRFAEAHGYLNPPFQVYHGGGLFATSTLERGSSEERGLTDLNRALARALGMIRGVLHSEFIRSAADGRFYFLETAALVRGANIDEMVEAATGTKLWREWARLEVANLRGKTYAPPSPRRDYAGLVISLARQEWPDTSDYTDPEIVWRLRKRHHVGLLVAAAQRARVQELITTYMHRFRDEFFATLPAATEAVD
jgi:biotin carboxylase